MSRPSNAVQAVAGNDPVLSAALTVHAGTPHAIRRAAQLIDNHAREALTVSEIAEVVGISVRSLQDGFRRHLSTTPTARLRFARLAGVRSDLLAADPRHDTVAELAHAWGFSHLGRFAQIYRQTFNESPSQTMRH